MKYQIEINYQTGNSFGSEDKTSTINEISWSDLNAAKKSLKAINDHYKLYMFFNKEWNANKKQREEALKKAMGKEWFRNSTNKSEKNFWEYSIGLTQDDGTIKFISPFWCGYFESLWSAEIVSLKPEDNDWKVSFR